MVFMLSSLSHRRRSDPSTAGTFCPCPSLDQVNLREAGQRVHISFDWLCCFRSCFYPTNIPEHRQTDRQIPHTHTHQRGCDKNSFYLFFCFSPYCMSNQNILLPFPLQLRPLLPWVCSLLIAAPRRATFWASSAKEKQAQNNTTNSSCFSRRSQKMKSVMRDKSAPLEHSGISPLMLCLSLMWPLTSLPSLFSHSPPWAQHECNPHLCSQITEQLERTWGPGAWGLCWEWPVPVTQETSSEVSIFFQC